MRCLWKTPSATANGTQQNGAPIQPPKAADCDMSVAKAEEMWEHIITVHLGISKDSQTNKFQMNEAAKDGSTRYSCHWGGCKNPAAQDQADVKIVAKHVQTHLPDTSAMGAQRRQHNLNSESLATLLHHDSSTSGKGFLNTAVDERSDAAGLPLASVLVLRNLARQMGKVDAANALAARTAKSRERWVEKCFAPVRERLFYVMAWNTSLREYLPALEGLVDKGITPPV